MSKLTVFERGKRSRWHYLWTEVGSIEILYLFSRWAKWTLSVDTVASPWSTYLEFPVRSSRYQAK